MPSSCPPVSPPTIPQWWYEDQAELALANGLTLDEAADGLHIRKNTARAHLRAIFSKIGVTRQTTLVRVLLSSVVWLG